MKLHSLIAQALFVLAANAAIIDNAHAGDLINKALPRKVHMHPHREKIHSAVQGVNLGMHRLPPITVKVDGKSISANTSSAADITDGAKVASGHAKLARAAGTTVSSTILIIARDAASAYSGFSGLQGYGIPYQVLTVPSTGAALPTLNSSPTSGNFGAIVVLGEVSYATATGGYQSALSPSQWDTLYAYQLAFGVRMVRLDTFPNAATGTTPLGNCCGDGVEQLVSLSDTSAFTTAGLKTGATMSTTGLWHYPASITNSSIAKKFLEFAPAPGFAERSTAAVINDIGGRQQMVFFLPFATDWNAASNFLQHSWIHWATRGLYAGYRRINFNTQIDDMFLISDIYSPAGNTFRLSPSDLDVHKSWMSTINAKLPAGSSYMIEIGHNGNGNIEASTANGVNCGIGPIEYAEQIDTPLEYKKPLGTGTNLWPNTPIQYPYTKACTNGDALKTWFATTGNRNAFYHVSHTFTHEALNEATYFDAKQEITWNQAWLAQVGLSGNAARFSPNGLIPPAITGLHNGDVLRAWKDNGIVNVVGDNTRPVLRNQCDTPACTVAEWQATASGQGDFTALLALEKNTNTRNLFGLYRDPFMFHQANLRAKQATVNGQRYSLLQAWVETVLGEMVRLVTWPIITLKHDAIATAFTDRMTRDGCNPKLTYNIDASAKAITGITVTTDGNQCAKPIPVTVPGSVTSTSGHATEKIGSDPLTVWVKMSGSPVSFDLSQPVQL
ncbi:hypothetical protein ACLOAV_010816 [Pseudogymnoascus australis]